MNILMQEKSTYKSYISFQQLHWYENRKEMIKIHLDLIDVDICWVSLSETLLWNSSFQAVVTLQSSNECRFTGRRILSAQLKSTLD